MMFYKKIVISIAMFFLGFFGYLAFSDEVNTRYTEFYLLSGGEYSNHLIVNLTGGETGYTDLYLENLSDSTFDGKISFVDGSIINYGSTGVNICKSENEKNIFGQYMGIDNDSFSILSQGSLTKQLNLNFPRRYSGVYYGCVVYYPNISEGSSALNTSVRKAIFLDVNVTPVYSLVGLRVYPGSRGNTTNPNINGFENRGRLLFYNNGDRATVVYSGYVDINNDGSGDMLEGIAGGYYDVVYKGWHQLSSVISGIYITGGQEILLDFTTGTNLYGVENGILYMGGSGYQIGGDMLSSSSTYDYQVNSTDLSVLYGSQCPYMTSVGSPMNSKYKCDLNNDGWIDSSDASVIISNDWRDDFVYGTGGQFSNFGLTNY